MSNLRRRSHNDPEKDEKIQGNPFNTLFVARLSYELQESDLLREFEQYGPIKNIRLVRDLENKSRGYAFIEFEREKDMRAAYKDADGIKILGRRITVDVERGRTVKGWKPRRLGGGLGNARSGPPEKPPASDRYGSHSNERRDRGYGGGGYGGPGGGGGRYDNGYRSQGSNRGYGGGGGGGRYNDDRRRPRMRSRSPRGYREQRYGGDRGGGGNRGGRDRSRDRGRRYGGYA
ncbi:hypothetical protein BX666DRAFT_1582465 [Dichotomocladium elegans]|nr:hypothetical protein BX666DRAFT_1582465 [Dichotomocladium elegans]